MTAKNETLHAIFLFMLVLLGNATVFAIVPYISVPDYGFGYHPFQITLAYSAVALCCMVPWALKQGRAGLRTTRMKLYGFRAILEFVAFSLSFYSLQYLALPMHTALNFLTPLFGAIVAIIVLREHSRYFTWISLALGFAGMLIITRPGVVPFNIGVGYVLVAAFGFSLCGTVIKMLTHTESPNHVAFYMLLLTTIIALPFGIYHWKTPNLEGLGWLVLIGLIAYVQQILVAKAIAKVPYTTLAPINFSQLVFASVFSYVFYGKLIDMATLVGAVVIVAATFYNAWMNTRQAARLSVPVAA
jgi:drug/metabolite transporter (DMT)-like permease